MYVKFLPSLGILPLVRGRAAEGRRGSLTPIFCAKPPKRTSNVEALVSRLFFFPFPLERFSLNVGLTGVAYGLLRRLRANQTMALRQGHGFVARRRFLNGLCLRTNRQHLTRCGAHYRLRDATHQHARQPAPAVSAQNDQ